MSDEQKNKKLKGLQVFCEEVVQKKLTGALHPNFVQGPLTG